MSARVKGTVNNVLLIVVLLYHCAFIVSANAQSPIYYNRYTPATGLSAQLFRLGISTDTPIATGLIEGALPAVSRNGRFLAVTSVDSQRPGQVSKDLFARPGHRHHPAGD
jgi:hypothetical protein